MSGSEAAAAFGYEPRELVGRSLWDLVHPQSLEAMRERVSAFVASGDRMLAAVPQDGFVTMRKDGSTAAYRANCMRMDTASGRGYAVSLWLDGAS